MSEENKFQDDSLLNRAELSRALNVSKPYITKLIKNGILIFNFENGKKIKLSDAKKSIEENSDPNRKEFKKENIENKKVVELKEPIKKNKSKIKEDNEEEISDEDLDFFLGKNIEDFRKEVSELSFSEAKTKNEQMKLIISKIKADKELGLLVSIDEVNQNSFEIGKVLNQSLLSIPNRLCDILANMSDPKKIYNKLNEEIKKVMEEVIEKLEGFQ